MATKLNFLQYTYRFRINHKTLYSQTFPGPHFGPWTIGNFTLWEKQTTKIESSCLRGFWHRFHGKVWSQGIVWYMLYIDNAVLHVVQSSAVITRSHISWYHKLHYTDSNRKLTSIWTHKRHPIPRRERHAFCKELGKIDRVNAASHCTALSNIYRELSTYYCQISNISHTRSQTLKVSCLVLQLFLPKPLKPGIKSRMKM